MINSVAHLSNKANCVKWELSIILIKFKKIINSKLLNERTQKFSMKIKMEAIKFKIIKFQSFIF
jgi:hypothetical protein